MIRLGVNVDHVATVRQARLGVEPDPVAAAMLATLGGADGITIHLREDRRHIQDRDLDLLRATVTTRLNLELATESRVLDIAVRFKPDEATLVPEKRQELTTEGGLDLVRNADEVRKAINQLKSAGVLVSVFIDPDQRQIDMARKLDADAIEFQTGTYSEAKSPSEIQIQLEALREATHHARVCNLHVHMGHGLNYLNVQAITAIEGVEELNIGHSIISRAILVGMQQAVRDMKYLMDCHANQNSRKQGP